MQGVRDDGPEGDDHVFIGQAQQLAVSFCHDGGGAFRLKAQHGDLPEWRDCVHSLDKSAICHVNLPSRNKCVTTLLAADLPQFWCVNPRATLTLNSRPFGRPQGRTSLSHSHPQRTISSQHSSTQPFTTTRGPQSNAQREFRQSYNTDYQAGQHGDRPHTHVYHSQIGQLGIWPYLGTEIYDSLRCVCVVQLIYQQQQH